MVFCSCGFLPSDQLRSTALSIICLCFQTLPKSLLHQYTANLSSEIDLRCRAQTEIEDFVPLLAKLSEGLCM
jgi:hypothetical protein